MKSRNIFFIFILVVLVFSLSGCNSSLTGNAIKSSPLGFKCTGEAAVLLRDYCFDSDTGDLKMLFENGGISDLKHVNTITEGTRGQHTDRLQLPIEMGEHRLLVQPMPKNIGEPLTMNLKVFYFGNSGMESCVDSELDLTIVRTCEPVKKSSSDAGDVMAPPIS